MLNELILQKTDSKLLGLFNVFGKFFYNLFYTVDKYSLWIRLGEITIAMPLLLPGGIVPSNHPEMLMCLVQM